MNTSFALSAYQWQGVWGERTTSTPSRGYCANLGHLEDEMGLVYMRARYYEPTTGRFISEDPARHGVNWYLYADGDPVGKVDASGQKAMHPILQLTVFGLLLGFFGQLGAYLGEDMALQQHTPLEQIFEGSFRSGLYSSLFGAAVGWFFQWMFGTEGALIRIPQRIGYAQGFWWTAKLSFGAGFASAVALQMGLRAGQALLEMFLIDWEAQH
jgi:RHS repeat-associated protein